MFGRRSLKCFNLLSDLVYFCPAPCLHNKSFAARIGSELFKNDYTKNFYHQIKPYSKAAKTPLPPVSGKLNPEANAKKKTLDGGVTISDITLGSGAPVKSGKTVTVYYSGRLKATSKLFDAMTSGSGLTFRLGRGEVIDGWDIGLVGMKVGGKRVITCPPSMAYGEEGFPPKIPPNSTLVFEVELKSVK